MKKIVRLLKRFFLARLALCLLGAQGIYWGMRWMHDSEGMTIVLVLLGGFLMFLAYHYHPRA